MAGWGRHRGIGGTHRPQDLAATVRLCKPAVTSGHGGITGGGARPFAAEIADEHVGVGEPNHVVRIAVRGRRADAPDQAGVTAPVESRT